jgi:hypothetical protein
VVFTTREAAEAIARGDIKQLRRQMANFHPDRGGTAGSSWPHASGTSGR